MKKIGFLSLFVLVFLSGCGKNIDIKELSISSGAIATTAKESLKQAGNIAKKIETETKQILNIDKETQKESSANTNIKTDQYENKKGNFSLNIDPNRGFEEDIGSSLVVFFRELADGTKKATISISQLPLSDEEKNISLIDYYNQNKLGIRDAIVDFTEIAQNKIKIDGKEALEVIYEGIQNNKDFQVKQIFFQNLDKMAIITYISAKKYFQTYQKEVSQIINSIKFNQK